MSGKLTPQMLDELMDQEYRQKNKYFANFEGTDSAKHLSADDRFKNLADDLVLSLSDPLKKLRVAYLRDSNKNCY